jgi:hypothetical protein
MRLFVGFAAVIFSMTSLMLKLAALARGGNSSAQIGVNADGEIWPDRHTAVMQSLTSEVSGITPFTHSSDLQARLIEYASHIGAFRTPNDVLDALHVITTKSLPLCVLGAVRFPLKATDWNSVQLGKSVFLHKDVPEGWWEEHAALSPGRFSPHLFLASRALLLTRGLRFSSCSSPLASIDGLLTWRSNMACVTV